MRHNKGITMALLVVAVVLFVLQGGIWARSQSHARTETNQQNLVIQHPPSEMPGLIGMGLLLVAMIVASTPQHPKDHHPHHIVGSKSHT
jgi:hypothetical protein